MSFQNPFFYWTFTDQETCPRVKSIFRGFFHFMEGYPSKALGKKFSIFSTRKKSISIRLEESDSEAITDKLGAILDIVQLSPNALLTITSIKSPFTGSLIASRCASPPERVICSVLLGVKAVSCGSVTNSNHCELCKLY